MEQYGEGESRVLTTLSGIPGRRGVMHVGGCLWPRPGCAGEPPP